MATNLDYPLALTPVRQSVTEQPIGDGAGRSDVEVTRAPTGKAAERELERLYAESQVYAQRKGHWRFLAMAYEGGPAYVTEETLFRHEREHHDSFTQRLKRAHYWNFCAPLNDFVPDHIFRDPPELKPDDSIRAAFTKFEKNVDRMGTSIDQFMRRAAEDARLYGLAWIGIDKPAIDPQRPPLTLQDDMDQGLDAAYWYLVRRPEVLDYEVDQFGSYLYLKRLVPTRRRAGSTWRALDRVIEWTQKDVRVTEIDVTDPKKRKLLPATTTQHQFGVVPMVPVFNRRSKFRFDEGVSCLEDIAYQNRQVYNQTSILDEFLYRQCFNILVREQDTAIPSKDEGSTEVGTSNLMEIPRGVTNKPFYLTPPIDPAGFIQGERDAVIREMYRQAVQDSVHEIFDSGEAQRAASSRSIPNIARLADELQVAQVQALRLWAKASNLAWSGKVAYRRDFSITTFMDMVLQLSGIFNNLRVLPPRFVREEWKRVIREFDTRLEPDALVEIDSQIDAISDEDLVGRYDKPPAPGDVQAQGALPSAANLLQGVEQTHLGTDQRRALATGDRADTKEGVRDAQRRTSQPAVRDQSQNHR
jgi:hypothetical protein